MSRTKPITHDGVTYPSQTALARALGLTRSAVSLAVRLGRVQSLGTGARRPATNMPLSAWEARRQPCAALGHSWPSQRHCANALGVSQSAVYLALRRGTFEALVTKYIGRAAT